MLSCNTDSCWFLVSKGRTLDSGNKINFSHTFAHILHELQLHTQLPNTWKSSRIIYGHQNCGYLFDVVHRPCGTFPMMTSTSNNKFALAYLHSWSHLPSSINTHKQYINTSTHTHTHTIWSLYIYKEINKYIFVSLCT